MYPARSRFAISFFTTGYTLGYKNERTILDMLDER